MVTQPSVESKEPDARQTLYRQKTLQVLFGRDETKCVQTPESIDVHVKIPVLGEESRERIFSCPGQVYQKFGFYILESDDYLIGAMTKEVEFPLEKATYEIYMDFLELTKDWNLYRVWHYVPYINEETSSLENYRSFCKARSLAFEAFYGEGFDVELPAASAVGIDDNHLVMYFLAGKERGQHVENPEQIAAYKYPKRYGPRSPSFARGTVLVRDNKQIGFLSGTASIKSHESVTLSDMTEQLYTTVDNMSLVFEEMGLLFERQSYGHLMPDPAKHDRTFKVYIRRAEDAAHVRELFPKLIMATKDDHIVYLQSDVCRFELDIEIEAIIEER
jgi:chorismate lyase / 3-hydroxybenzoate synthase